MLPLWTFTITASFALRLVQIVVRRAFPVELAFLFSQYPTLGRSGLPRGVRRGVDFVSPLGGISRM